MLFIAERVARRGGLETDYADDVAGIDVGYVLAMVGVHTEYAPQTLPAVLGGVYDRLARFDAAGVHADERELSDERVGHDLKRKRGERRFVVCLAGDLLAVGGVYADDGRDVHGGRKVVHDRVKQLLDALVSVGRAAEHREHLHGDRTLADGLPEQVLGDLLSVEVKLHHLPCPGIPLLQFIPQHLH